MHGMTADAAAPKEDGEGWPSPLGGSPILQHISYNAQLCSIFFLLQKWFLFSRDFLILCTIMSLSEIYTLICFQHKKRCSISIGNCKLFYFSGLYFLLQGGCLKFHPSVFHMSQLFLQNLYFRFRCHINQCSHVLFVIIISSKSNIIFQSVEVSSS